MPALVLEMPGRAENREVVAFGPAAGKDDLARLAGPNPRDAVPRIVEQRASLSAHVVKAGWIPVNFAKIRQHRIADLRRERRRSVVVEINRAHNRSAQEKRSS